MTTTNIQTVIHHELSDEEAKRDFRVSIFGSARLAKSDPLYTDIFELSKTLADRNIGVVTGGGPGVMEAANEGHKAGDQNNSAQSIGLTIELPFEAEGNEYLDVQRHFMKFSGRLDQFMRLSNVIVVMPGGIGTCLELFYTWQLIQVGHICNIPIILHGGMWETLLEWVKDYPLAENRMSPEDLNMICVTKNNEETLKIINDAQQGFLEAGDNYCLNVKKYQ